MSSQTTKLYRITRTAIMTMLIALPLVAIANGCGGNNDGAQTVIFVSPSSSPTNIPVPPINTPFPSPSPIIIGSPSPSPFGTPSPLPSPPPIGGI